ncbi:MAG: hypothetical protein AB1714_10565 [Acidobacteriota bacterium]
MTDDLHQRAKQIFVAASDLPPEAREAFVSEECAGDRALWDEVMSLLRFHDSAGSASAPAWARARWDGADSIGAYRLLEKPFRDIFRGPHEWNPSTGEANLHPVNADHFFFRADQASREPSSRYRDQVMYQDPV